MQVLRALFFVIATTAFCAAADGAPLARASRQTQVEDARRTFVAESTTKEARVASALVLLRDDPSFVRDQLGPDAPLARVEAVSAALDLALAALGEESAARVVPALLRIASAVDPSKAREVAEAALRSFDRARPELSRPLLRSALLGVDAAQIATAARLLGASRDPRELAPLAQVLAATSGNGSLAESVAAALEEILPAGYGRDVARWRELARNAGDRPREELLADLLAAQRSAFEAAAAQRDAELIELKIKLHSDNREALIADLDDALPGLRKRAAEALLRRVAEWDLAPARGALIERLASGEEPGDVVAARIRLLVAIDQHAQKRGDDPTRDRALGKRIGSADGVVVAAAAAAAAELGAASLAPAVAAALGHLLEDPLTPAARGALVDAAGRMKLVVAKDAVVARLYDRDAGVRTIAAAALGALGAPDTREHLERALREDADWHVRHEAARSLPKVAGPAAAEALLLALQDAQVDVKSVAVEEAARLGGPLVVAALLERMVSDFPLRIDIVRGLGVIGPPAASDALEPLCDIVLSLPPERAPNVDPSLDQLRKACRDALASIARSDVAAWRKIVARVAARGRPRLEQWAAGQLVRALTESAAPAAELAPAERAFAASALAAGDVATALSVVEARLAAPGALSHDERAEFQLLRAEGLWREHGPPDALPAYDELLADPELSASARERAVRGASELHVARGDARRAIEILSGLPADAPTDLLRRLARLEVETGDAERAEKRLKQLRDRAGLDAADRLAITLDLVEALLANGDAAGAAKELPADADLANWLPEETAFRLKSLRTAVAEESHARPGGG